VGLGANRVKLFHIRKYERIPLSEYFHFLEEGGCPWDWTRSTFQRVPKESPSGDPRSLLAGTRRPVSCLGSGGIQYMSSFPTKTPKPRPEAGPWNPEARTRSQSRNPEAGVGTRKMETSARRMGHQTSLSVVLSCTSARCERICSLIGDVCPGEWTKIFDPMQTHGRHASMGMCLVCSCTLDPDDFFSFIKMRCCPHGWDWSELAANGELGNVCIKGDASSHTPDTCAASVAILGLSSDFSLHFLRLSSSMDRVDECMGPEPGILRGRILARLGIRGMRRFNKTRSPKLRILMLDSAGLACASWACKSCNGLSFRSLCRSPYWGTFGMFFLVPGDNLVDSWYRSRSLGHVVCGEQPQSMLGWPGIVLSWNPEDPGHALPKSEGCMDFRPGTRRLNALSSQNPEAGWTFVQGPGGRIDYHPGTRRLDGLSSWNPEAGWTFVQEPKGWMNYRPRTRRLDGLSSWNPKAGWTIFLEHGGWNPMIVWTFRETFSYIYLFLTRSRLHRKCLPLSKPGSVFQCVVQLQLGRLKDGTICVSIGMHHIPPSLD
ncbi:LOW QUALITY PROTEIN: hypothetical protein HID58_087324, partial [Brassica napus]